MKEFAQGDPFQLYEVKLLSRKRITGKVVKLEFERPPDFSFNAGQRIRIIHERGERDYSLISAPQETHLALLIRVVEGGALSPVLAKAEIGTSFFIRGPRGYFVWLPSERPSVFVATGTGAAPFISMAKSGVKDFIFLHGAKRIEDLYERPLFRGAAATYVACLSYPGHWPDADVFEGRVTRFLRDRLNSGLYDFYLCGRKEMIRDATLIVDEKFSGSSVYSEPFY